MARFGWAYVDCTDGVNIDGVTGSVMFLTGNNSISGSNHLLYNYNGSVPGAGGAQHSLILTGTLYVSGAISASSYHYEDITRIESSGSTRFGNTVDDVHIRTGSLKVVWPTGVGASANPLLHVDLYTSQSINMGMRVGYQSIGSSSGEPQYASSSTGYYLFGVKGTGPVEIRVHAASASLDDVGNLIDPSMTGSILVFKDESTARTASSGGSSPPIVLPGAIVLSGTDGETIDGQPYYVLTGTMASVSLYSNGSNWFVF
jgi:hypothetical protein